MSSWGGWEATGYVPPSAGQAGAARHRTERWEPRAEGRQQEGTFKPLVRRQPHPRTGRAEAPAAGTESRRGFPDASAVSWAVHATGRPPADGVRVSAAAVGSGCSQPPNERHARCPCACRVGAEGPAAHPARRPPRTQLQEPALAVGVEERVRQVVAVVLRDLERLVLDALVQVLREDRGHRGGSGPGRPCSRPARGQGHNAAGRDPWPSPAAAPRAGPRPR